MSTFKHNKGKLVEQPDEKDLKKYPQLNAYMRTYIAEGFAEDELVEEKDFGLIDVAYNVYTKAYCDINHPNIDWAYHQKKTIARKITKEEGEKPDWKKEFRTQIINAWSFLRTENNGIPDNVVDFMKDQSLKALNNLT